MLVNWTLYTHPFDPLCQNLDSSLHKTIFSKLIGVLMFYLAKPNLNLKFFFWTIRLLLKHLKVLDGILIPYDDANLDDFPDFGFIEFEDSGYIT